MGETPNRRVGFAPTEIAALLSHRVCNLDRTQTHVRESFDTVMDQNYFTRSRTAQSRLRAR